MSQDSQELEPQQKSIVELINAYNKTKEEIDYMVAYFSKFDFLADQKTSNNQAEQIAKDQKSIV